jgi:small conductance mechanosensitive channel
MLIVPMENILLQITQSSDGVVALLLAALAALAIAIAFIIIARVLRNLVKKVVTQTTKRPNLAVLLSNLTFVIVLTVGLLGGLGILTGAGISALIASLGFVTAAIGVAVQDIVRNFVAGVFLLVEEPFAIGERIMVKDVEGVVTSIRLRATEIRTDSGVHVIVPNLIVFTEVVTNQSNARQHRINTIWLSVPSSDADYTSLNQKIGETLNEIAPHPTAAPKPRLVIETVTANVMQLRLEYWTTLTSVPSEEVLATLSRAIPEATLSRTRLPLPSYSSAASL